MTRLARWRKMEPETVSPPQNKRRRHRRTGILATLLAAALLVCWVALRQNRGPRLPEASPAMRQLVLQHLRAASRNPFNGSLRFCLAREEAAQGGARASAGPRRTER